MGISLEQMLKGFENTQKTLELQIAGHEANVVNINRKIILMKQEHLARSQVIVGLQGIKALMPKDETITLFV